MEPTDFAFPVSLVSPVSRVLECTVCFLLFLGFRQDSQWKSEPAWNGAGVGWFKGPRTLPLILALLSDKRLTAGRDVSRVYLELLARHMDGGVVEIGNEGDHAYAAGYTGARTVRSWTGVRPYGSTFSPTVLQTRSQGGGMAKKQTVRGFDENLPELIRLYKAGSSIADLKRRWRCYGNPLVARLKKAGVYRPAKTK